MNLPKDKFCKEFSYNQKEEKAEVLKQLLGSMGTIGAGSVVKTDIDVMAESIESGLQNDEIRKIYYRRRLTVEIWSILPGLSCLTR